MDLAPFQDKFAELTIKRDYKGAMAFINGMILQKMDPHKIIVEVISRTLHGLQRFDESPDASGYSSLTLLAIARICDDAIKKLLPLLPQQDTFKGTVVIGTPPNDYHGLGKTIVSAILRSSGWNVVDLGLNVDSGKFIAEAAHVNADFILVSAFLLPSALKTKEIADALRASPLRGKTRLIVGGPPFKFHMGLAQKLGCDGSGIDAFDAIRVLNGLKGYDMGSIERAEKTSRFQKFAKRVFSRFRRNEST